MKAFLAFTPPHIEHVRVFVSASRPAVTKDAIARFFSRCVVCTPQRGLENSAPPIILIINKEDPRDHPPAWVFAAAKLFLVGISNKVLNKLKKKTKEG